MRPRCLNICGKAKACLLGQHKFRGTWLPLPPSRLLLPLGSLVCRLLGLGDLAFSFVGLLMPRRSTPLIVRSCTTCQIVCLGELVRSLSLSLSLVWQLLQLHSSDSLPLYGTPYVRSFLCFMITVKEALLCASVHLHLCICTSVASAAFVASAASVASVDLWICASTCI